MLGYELRTFVTPRDKRQRTFKFSGNTEAQLAQLSLATGSGATAVVEQALAHYYRNLFGSAALNALMAREPAPQPDGLPDGRGSGDGLGEVESAEG